MPDFSQWLPSQNNTDPNVRDLNNFAAANKAIWPAASNELADYREVVSQEPIQGKRDALLTTLGRYYERWFQNERENERGKPHWTTICLMGFGGIIGGVLIYSIFFVPGFFPMIGKTDNARGLITFLFAFGSIGIFILAAIALFWMKVSELEQRFAKAKDLLTILIGILGTIIGFYFGTASGKP